MCTVAPIPGETKVWQYVSLMKRIYLIDCPGVVPPSSTDTPTDLVLRGVARVEKVDNPEQYIPALLQRVKRHHMEKTYELRGWENSTEFLDLLARKGGRLLRGGEPDLDGVAKMVLNDFMRGKIPWFTPPPVNGENEGEGVGGRSGKLGEMPRKRARDVSTDDADVSVEAQIQQEASRVAEKHAPPSSSDSEEEFEGFGTDTETSQSANHSFGPSIATSSGRESDRPEDLLVVDESSDDDGSPAPSSMDNARPNKRPRT